MQHVSRSFGDPTMTTNPTPPRDDAPDTIWLEAEFATHMRTAQPRYGHSVEYRRASLATPAPDAPTDNTALVEENIRLRAALRELACRQNWDGYEWVGTGFTGACIAREALTTAALSREAPQAVTVERDDIAFEMWREEASVGTPGMFKGRTREAWADQSEDTRNKWLRFAGAALRALGGRT